MSQTRFAIEIKICCLASGLVLYHFVTSVICSPPTQNTHGMCHRLWWHICPQHRSLLAFFCQWIMLSLDVQPHLNRKKMAYVAWHCQSNIKLVCLFVCFDLQPHLYRDSLVKQSQCSNAVTQTTSVPKNEISVVWSAPNQGTGCVVFKWVTRSLLMLNLTTQHNCCYFDY